MSERINNRKLNIVFVLDTTWSMGRDLDRSGMTIMDRMNNLVEKMMREIVANPKTSEVTEIAFLTFADDITMETKFKYPMSFTETDFVPVRWNQKVDLVSVNLTDYRNRSHPALVPKFNDVGTGTSSRIGRAVKYAVKKLIDERDRLIKENGKENVRFYAPIMILITDGAPRNQYGEDTMDPEEEKEAIDLVYKHCRSIGNASNLICPVICGIGDEQVENHLKQYSAGYTKGFQHIKEEEQSKGFEELIKRIETSITRSFDLNEMDNYKKGYDLNLAAVGGATKMGTETYRVFSLNDQTEDEDDEI